MLNSAPFAAITSENGAAMPAVPFGSSYPCKVRLTLMCARNLGKVNIFKVSFQNRGLFIIASFLKKKFQLKICQSVKS